MTDTSSIKVQEVRNGLYRIHWIFSEVMKKELGEYKEAFHLSSGTQSHQIYTINYHIKSANGKDSKQGGKYEYSITVAEKSECQPISRDASSSNPKILDCAYLFMDNKFAHGNEIPLNKITAGKWMMKCVHPTYREHLTLWMDFGADPHLNENVMDVMKGLSEMFHKQILCDIQFEFNDGQTIGAHVSILSARSPVFSAMFQSGMVESQTRRVIITDISTEVFRQLLIYLYTGYAPKLEEESMTPPLLEAAEKYGVEILKNQCCTDVLQKRVSLDNSINLLVWSHMHSITKLFEATMEFIVRNLRDLCYQPQWKKLATDFPDLCVMATQRIAGPPTVTIESDSDD
ncbi:hypothetical protein DAPPUDRAFT_193467 [Daphnia pulex]|uniref:BTB domain-containing protein n=1 Tax=Daphnia pulex TaxID=6669 RepID=E9G355_DAPPU|nr:hypothetical protein DAPPUDRAFT_193467 [Daphnia pulex]|eukprot:EFX86049.1 hypothetical protein DAPPUDRAFT_193467 [Daphnia pulex]